MLWGACTINRDQAYSVGLDPAGQTAQLALCVPRYSNSRYQP